MALQSNGPVELEGRELKFYKTSRIFKGTLEIGKENEERRSRKNAAR